MVALIKATVYKLYVYIVYYELLIELCCTVPGTCVPLGLLPGGLVDNKQTLICTVQWVEHPVTVGIITVISIRIHETSGYHHLGLASSSVPLIPACILYPESLVASIFIE